MSLNYFFLQPRVSYADERRLLQNATDVLFFLSFFLAPNLLGRSVDRHQMLTHVRWWQEFIKFCQKFGCPSPKKFGCPKNFEIWANFGQLPNLVVNISGMKQEIVQQKTAL